MKQKGSRPRPASGVLGPSLVAPPAKMVPLTPERMLLRAARRFLTERTSACVKCGSVFIVHEPMFVHCRYCGCIARIANRSLVDQEEFELRSGLRVAS